MPYLQPYHIFLAEATRVNTLYWTSKYSYTRMSAVLKAIAQTSTTEPNPPVSILWNTSEFGEQSHLTKRLSEFIDQLNNNATDLRTTAILHMCSAFETALANYFALCALYLPQQVSPSYRIGKVPEILQDEDKFDTLKKWAIKKASEKLSGKYTKRIQTIETTFRVPSISNVALSRIDGYYDIRHLIAHDQGLQSADAPDLSVEEVLTLRVSMDEATWKSMIADFIGVAEELDGAIQQSVVKDQAVAIAIFHIMGRDRTEINLSELRHKIATERKLGKLPLATVKQIAEQLSYRLKHISGKNYRILPK